MNPGSLAIDIRKHAKGLRTGGADRVAIEEPLEIRLGFSTGSGPARSSMAITMRTPGDDIELAAGFLLSESIVRRSGDIDVIGHCAPPTPDIGSQNVVHVELSTGVEFDLERLQRHFYTTSSCGVCGKSSLDALRVAGCTPFDDSMQVSSDVLVSIPARLRAAQTTFDATGGLHAAASFDAGGNLVCTREDVGRHNAVDKVIGRMLLDDMLPGHDRGLIVSGRASFELVQKSLVAGIPILAAVSAPSSLAIDLAREFNMTLVGFLRGDTFNVYAGEHRLSV